MLPLLSVLGVISLLMYYVIVLLGSTESMSNLFQPELAGSFFKIFTMPRFWTLFVCGPIICLLPDLSVTIFRRVFKKNPVDHAMALEQQEQVHRLKRKKTGVNDLEDTVVIEAKPLFRNDSPVRRIPTKTQTQEEAKARALADETSSVLPSVGGGKPKSKKESSQGLMN